MGHRRFADRATGFTNSSGPIVAKGKVIQGLHGCDRFRAERALLHQRLRRGDRQAAVEVQHHRAHGRAGRRYLGHRRRRRARRRRDLDRRQLRSRSRSHLLGHRAGQAVDAGQPRQQDLRRGALHRLRPWRCTSSDGKLAWHFQHVPGESLDLDEVFETRAGRHRPRAGSSSRSARPASCGSSIARPASSSATSRPCSRTCSTRSIREKGTPTYRQDIIEQKLDEWLTVCPSTEGGHNWQAMTYHAPTNQLIIPLSQSCMEMSPRKVAFEEGSGGTVGRPPLLRDAGQRRQRRQAAGDRRARR